MEDCKEHKKELDGFGKRVTHVELEQGRHDERIKINKESINKQDDDFWEAIKGIRKDNKNMLASFNESMTKILTKLAWIVGIWLVMVAIVTFVGV